MSNGEKYNKEYWEKKGKVIRPITITEKELISSLGDSRMKSIDNVYDFRIKTEEVGLIFKKTKYTFEYCVTENGMWISVDGMRGKEILYIDIGEICNYCCERGIVGYIYDCRGERLHAPSSAVTKVYDIIKFQLSNFQECREKHENLYRTTIRILEEELSRCKNVNLFDKPIVYYMLQYFCTEKSNYQKDACREKLKVLLIQENIEDVKMDICSFLTDLIVEGVFEKDEIEELIEQIIIDEVGKGSYSNAYEFR